MNEFLVLTNTESSFSHLRKDKIGENGELILHLLYLSNLITVSIHVVKVSTILL